MSILQNNVLAAAIGSLFILFLVLLWLVIDIKRKWGTLFGKSQNTGNTEFTRNVLERITHIETEMEAARPQTAFFSEATNKSIQKMSFKRYNPFQDTGSDQSFSLALLDHKNNGVIISSLYLREGVRVYGKRVEAGKAAQTLFDEEKEVLEDALKQK